MCKGITISQRIKNYEDEIASLKRQVDALTELNDNHAFNAKYFKVEYEKTSQKLLESHARESMLREAVLEVLSEVVTEYTDELEQALELQHNDDALKQFRYAVIEECAVICDGDSNFDDMTGSDCAAAIRALNPTTR